MPITHIQAVTKKEQLLQLDSGEQIALRIADMHHIVIFCDDLEIGRLRFSALSSLNNVEIRPLYQLEHYSYTPLALLHEKQALCTAAIALFENYTNGRIKIGKGVDTAGNSSY